MVQPVKFYAKEAKFGITQLNLHHYLNIDQEINLLLRITRIKSGDRSIIFLWVNHYLEVELGMVQPDNSQTKETQFGVSSAQFAPLPA